MKKSILIGLLAFLCFKSFSQCPLIVKSDTDKFTKDITKSNKDQIVLTNGNSKLSLLIAQIHGRVITIIVTVSNIGCVNDESKIYFLGENDSTVITNNNGKFDCQGNFTAYLVQPFFQNGATLEFLKTIKIKAIRVSAMSNIKDFDVDKNTSQRIYDIINCLSQ